MVKSQMEHKLPKRKHPRLNQFDYSSAGAYFVTICTQNKRCVLSRIVGRGLAPAETIGVEYTPLGEIAKQQLLLLETRYPYLKIEQYVIMPNHIHVILLMENKAAGASPRPTLMDIICTYKSLVTIACKKNGYADKLFQTSFHEHIIRGLEDHVEIHENPMRWAYDELFVA